MQHILETASFSDVFDDYSEVPTLVRFKEVDEDEGDEAKKKDKYVFPRTDDVVFSQQDYSKLGKVVLCKLLLHYDGFTVFLPKSIYIDKNEIA